ncbi:hypothetical protein BDV28DRAFT_150832 [Aspergillus coremiiformis]|uniref:Uncharacterized protein n=1 Tax=Aspergillus coremiiformis TaxID=138285 RepID=A0A5N6YZF9_9EURO|nr:hypothetical protein BDV28DRAFT_150832 [Aspergillus coremiiformis]
MKLSALAISLLSLQGTAHPIQDEEVPVKHLVPVRLPPPENWIAGPRLFPRDIIAAYHAPHDEYDAPRWRAYVNRQCEHFAACTSTLAFSAINIGSTGGRYWFGYVFRGGPTNAHDYVRDWSSSAGVEESAAFSVGFEDGEL